jgi:hypothetical protein
MLRLERCWIDAAIRWHPPWPDHTRFGGILLRPNVSPFCCTARLMTSEAYLLGNSRQ